MLARASPEPSSPITQAIHGTLVQPCLTSSQPEGTRSNHQNQPTCPESRDRQVFGRSFGKEGCTRGENPFYRKKGFSPLVKLKINKFYK